MVPVAAPAAYWKSSTTIADPAGSFAASFAIDAVTSADMAPSIASRSAASAPNPGSTFLGASTNPAQNRTGLASASSHDSQAVTSGGRAAAQLDSSTLLPAPADPTTTVSRCSAPAVSRRCSADLATSVAGGVGGRNFVSANRAPRESPGLAAASSATTPSVIPAALRPGYQLTGSSAPAGRDQRHCWSGETNNPRMGEDTELAAGQADNTYEAAEQEA